MDYVALKAELTDDPLVRGYAGMSDEEAAADLNTEYRTRNKDTMTGSEILQAIDQTEFLAKTEAQQQRVWDLLHLGTLNPFGVESDLFVGIFGGGSATITALAAARVGVISRATELGLRYVRAGYVQRARE